MNGPQHYRTAEELVAGANAMMTEMAADTRMDDPAIAYHALAPALLLAQVHATLALAAAQVEDMESGELRPGWARIVDEDWGADT